MLDQPMGPGGPLWFLTQAGEPHSWSIGSVIYRVFLPLWWFWVLFHTSVVVFAFYPPHFSHLQFGSELGLGVRG